MTGLAARILLTTRPWTPSRCGNPDQLGPRRRLHRAGPKRALGVRQGRATVRAATPPRRPPDHAGRPARRGDRTAVQPRADRLGREPALPVVPLAGRCPRGSPWSTRALTGAPTSCLEPPWRRPCRVRAATVTGERRAGTTLSESLRRPALAVLTEPAARGAGRQAQRGRPGGRGRNEALHVVARGGEPARGDPGSGAPDGTPEGTPGPADFTVRSRTLSAPPPPEPSPRSSERRAMRGTRSARARPP